MINIDITKIEAALTSKTKAILGVHLYGRLYNVSGLENLCNAHNLILIEDAAQAHGASFLDGRKTGNLSNAAAFSFYPTKNLGALGDAGAITTNDNDLAEIIKKLRNYGKKSTYINEIKGHNCRLDELQAAILRVKLKYLDGQNQKRREIAKVYLDTIRNSDIILPNFKDINEHVFHLFVIRNSFRDRLKEYLLNRGVETLIHYPIPIHKQKAYKEYKELNLPITEKLHNEILSIPLNQSLEEREVALIADLLSNFK